MQTAESSLVIRSFPNVRPAKTVSEGITWGYYDNFYHFITDETVPLQPVEVEKNLYLICFNRIVEKMEYVWLLRAEGKRPCQNAPNYLLGLMAQVPENKMPTELRGKSIVAAEPDNPSSVFTIRSGKDCFLYVSRHRAYRGLGLTFMSRRWHEGWAFLVEDLYP